MADIVGTPNDGILQGSNDDDTIRALNGQDLVSAEGGEDSIRGGNGNETLFGDAGAGTAPGNTATALVLDIDNLVTRDAADDDAEPEDFAIYRNVAQLNDGTQVSARLVLVSKSDDDLFVDLSGGRGSEILMNGDGTGNTASFRLEFFIPDAPYSKTGTPVALNSVATVNDLDRNANPNDREAVTIDANSFTEFGVSGDSSLAVTRDGDSVTAAGTEGKNPQDQDAWFSASLENRSFIEFALESRSTNSGFSFSGDLIDGAVFTPFEAGDDTLVGGDGQDQITLGPDNDRAEGDQGSDGFAFEGLGNHTIVGGEDSDGSDIDVIDLRGVDANVINDATGPESGVIELLDSNGNVAGRVTFSEIEQIIICFTPGTRMATQIGEVPVEQLSAGDRVFARDNGIQTLRWVGRRDLTSEELRSHPEFQPVLIHKGALGKKSATEGHACFAATPDAHDLGSGGGRVRRA